jgi:hypothetical protein
MENLVKLLLLLVSKATFNSEVEQEDALELVRKVAEEVGAGDVVPPKPGPTNAPQATPPVEVPGPVAEPVPAAEQPPPPTSPEVANALGGTPGAAA